jgi:hypothetical protein
MGCHVICTRTASTPCCIAMKLTDATGACRRSAAAALHRAHSARPCPRAWRLLLLSLSLVRHNACAQRRPQRRALVLLLVRLRGDVGALGGSGARAVALACHHRMRARAHCRARGTLPPRAPPSVAPRRSHAGRRISGSVPLHRGGARSMTSATRTCRGARLRSLRTS